MLQGGAEQHCSTRTNAFHAVWCVRVQKTTGKTKGQGGWQGLFLLRSFLECVCGSAPRGARGVCNPSAGLGAQRKEGKSAVSTAAGCEIECGNLNL